jgi:hypothetical protein
MIQSYSNAALNGAIRSLGLSGEWGNRLHMLLREKKRRARLGVTLTY